MKNKTLSLIAFSIMAIIISGCTSNRLSLVDKGLVSTKKHNSEKVRILWSDVYQQDDQTWVYGVLKQRRPGTSSIKTHVDIQVSTKDGSVFYETISEDIYVPRNRIGKGVDWKRFRVHLPDALPVDAHISTIVHSGPHVLNDSEL
jgi:hypothetical protein